MPPKGKIPPALKGHQFGKGGVKKTPPPKPMPKMKRGK